MRFNQIEYFLELARVLNFTKASKNLYISQPALSKQIAGLEDQLGVKLFIRGNHTLSLTEAGVQLQRDLSDIWNRIESARNRVIEIGSKTALAV